MPESTQKEFTPDFAALRAKRWLTGAEACLFLNCSITTLRTLIHDGVLSAAKTGQLYTLDINDLDRLLERRKRRVPPYRRGTRPWVARRHARNRNRLGGRR